MSNVKRLALRLHSSMCMTSVHRECSFQDSFRIVSGYSLPIHINRRKKCYYTRSFNTSPIFNRHVILLRGLDFRATEQHVINLLEDVRVENGSEGVTFMYSESALRTGAAFVNLASEVDVETALLLNDQREEGNYITVLKSLDSSFQTTLSRSRVKPVRSLTGHSVTMVKISKRVTKQQVQDFFSPLEPVAIEFRLGKGVTVERPWQTRKAFVDFSSHEEAVKAMEKHTELLGKRTVSLILLSYPGKCTCYSSPPQIK